ncbi:MAG: alpha-amylase family protein [Rectinemataceae bacterium]|nr:alpha-amylase family protein [Spirochaetaceae bacterium]
MERSWQQLYGQCLQRWEAQGLTQTGEWQEFGERLEKEFERLASLLWRLYSNRPDFAYHLERIIAGLFAAYRERPDYLKERDRQVPPESGWFLSQEQVGAVAYVDRFAGSFLGLIERIPYLKELGVTYLHLMPFFRCPQPENDGGYAVSSYRETDPRLGTMDDLRKVAQLLAEEGIALVADFVFNHTSNEHEWALKAQAGDPEYQEFYWMFEHESEIQRYQPWLRDIFPEVRRGSFTWVEKLGRWVWTTFHSYQWDLKYANPAVFNAMVQEMAFLANAGIAILRLDAVAFTWKREGTSCENLEEAHILIQAFQSAARIACPSLLFKSEAIVHPDDIARYIDLRECQLSYNPLLMAELWEAAATREVRLLAHSLRKRHTIPTGCSWVNYVRCHDDIGWTFADEDAAELYIKGRDHRAFLNEFYMGQFPGSFSRGVSFQYNPVTGDRRICGTAASLAGIEQALDERDEAALDTAIRRLLLLYGIAFSAGGIPLIYLGDEVAALNRYEYANDPAQVQDSRWVHRPLWSDRLYEERLDASTVPGRVFAGFRRLAEVRKAHAVFSIQPLKVVDSGHPSVLAFQKHDAATLLTVLGNFGETEVLLARERVQALLAGRSGTELISGRCIAPETPLVMKPCELCWILVEIRKTY